MGGGPAASIEPHNHYPQTPAQQILMSAADRWGLLGLLAMIKNVGSEVDGGLSSVGTDLGTMGLDVGHSGCVELVSEISGRLDSRYPGTCTPLS